MDSVIIGGVALAFLVVGLGIGLYRTAALREQLRARDAQQAELKAALAAAEQAALRRQEDLRRVGEERARLAAELEAERRAAKERLEEALRNREQVRAEVEKLAGRLLDEKGSALLDRSQTSLKALLDPLGEKLKTFESKVEKTYDQENRDRARLLESLRILRTPRPSCTTTPRRSPGPSPGTRRPRGTGASWCWSGSWRPQASPRGGSTISSSPTPTTKADASGRTRSSTCPGTGSSWWTPSAP